MRKFKKIISCAVACVIMLSVGMITASARCQVNAGHAGANAGTQVANCTEPGGTLFFCFTCNRTFFNQTQSATGVHSYNAYKVCVSSALCGIIQGQSSGWRFMFRRGNFANIISHRVPEYGPHAGSMAGKQHDGIDVIAAGSSGAINNFPVYSVGTGTVDVAGYGTYARNYVKILTSATPRLSIYYMHFIGSPSVNEGSTVTHQTKLGNVGATGQGVSGAHLHFEVRNSSGTMQNPEGYYPSGVFVPANY